MEYNSQREKMTIPEYGRCVQKLIDFAKTINDREKRNLAAREIIKQMATIQQSNIKDAKELEIKLWDHFFIISNFEIDVDSPYPKPDLGKFIAQETPYYNTQKKEIPFRYYGSIVIEMIKKAILMDEGDEKEALVFDIANNMKKLYITWNKDAVNDKVIIEHLNVLSEGRLILSDDIELSSNFIIPSQNPSRVYKKKRKDYKSNYSNGQKKFHKKK